ncbi:hypothetical protein DRO32_04470, partial [Candidatus Bathyarchaeota archaeon]
MLSLRELEKRLSNRAFRLAFDALALAFFILVILFPTLFLFAYVATGWEEVRDFVFHNPVSGDIRWHRMLTAVAISFQVAAVTTALDLAFGIPLALLLARYDFRGRRLLDALVDLPLGVPSAALGASMVLFWATGYGIGPLFGRPTGLLSRGFWLVVLTHVAFTFPYIVRSLVGVIEGIDVTYEHASRTLGAPSFTTFRTITAPLSLPGIMAGAILAFTRSLGETGATMIVAGLVETAPLAVVSMHERRLVASAAFLSMLLVLVGLAMLGAMRFVAEKFGLPFRGAWPEVERKLSGRRQRAFRDIGTLSFLGALVILPSCFSIPYVARFWPLVVQAVFRAEDEKWKLLVDGLVTSFEVALLATAINLVMGLSMAILIVRRDWGRLNRLLDALVDLPLVIPTAALGFSVYLFWGPRGLGLLETGFWLIVLTHVAFTYPYVVRTLVAALRSVDPALEEAARTLGAPPLTAFRTVVLPLIGTGLFA